MPSPYPGFYPLPHRTGHEVCPHPALRQPSSWSIQDIHYSLHRRVLRGCFPGSSPLLLPSPRVTGSALSCSLFRANMSVLQVSLYVTGCCFASLSQGVTTLRHSQSPDCTGCLLRGLLSVTTTGLAPASKRCLSGHTTDPGVRIFRCLPLQTVSHPDYFLRSPAVDVGPVIPALHVRTG